MAPSGECNGFTLVELAIVLVIIALIVGGVLVGQDLIKAAAIRGQMSQIERYDAAANTFHNKYDSLPGDLPNPANFFSAITTTTGEPGLANGDGLIDSVYSVGPSVICRGNTGYTCISGESVLFWYELSQAGLIPDSITATDPTDTGVVPSSAVLPMAKIGLNTSVAIQADIGHNYWVINNFGTAATIDGMGFYSAGLTPLEAFAIDTKMDDGMPATGRVLSIAPSSGLPSGPFAIAGRRGARCASGTTPSSTYATVVPASGTATGNTVACSLSIRASF